MVSICSIVTGRVLVAVRDFSKIHCHDDCIGITFVDPFKWLDNQMTPNGM